MSNTKDFPCKCGELLIKSTTSGMKVRSKVLIVENGSMRAVCKSCNAEVKLPLTLKETPAPKIVISKKKIVDM